MTGVRNCIKCQEYERCVKAVLLVEGRSELYRYYYKEYQQHIQTYHDKWELDAQ